MGRAGRTRERDESERRCIVTGEVRRKGGLIRFVAGPDGALVPDLAEKLPGRGIWVSADRAAIDAAVKKRLFARAARTALVVPDDLAGQLESGLAQRVVELLSLARKAGVAVAGYEKVRGWLQTGQAAALLQASDGSERGKTKLRLSPDDGAYVDCLTAREMGLSFGREHVIHAALSAGGLTKRVVEDANRLSGLRKTDGDRPGKDDRIA